MSESEYYRRKLKFFLRRNGFTSFRIESGGTRIGIPDVYAYGATHQRQAWIEIKIYRNKNITREIKPDWRPGQIPLAKELSNSGAEWYLFLYATYHKLTLIFSEPKETYTVTENISEKKFIEGC